MFKKLIPITALLFTLPALSAEFEVFKSPGCGCCQKWTDALEAAGHEIVARHVENLHKIKLDAGLPAELSACHTAFVDGYVVEGHVPLEAIDELLEQKPKIKGIAVPGMPVESLGMEVGREPQPYTVYGFDERGEISPAGVYKGTERIE